MKYKSTCISAVFAFHFLPNLIGGELRNENKSEQYVIKQNVFANHTESSLNNIRIGTYVHTYICIVHTCVFLCI